MHTFALYHAQIKALQPKSKHTKGYCKNICWYVQVLFSFFLFFLFKALFQLPAKFSVMSDKYEFVPHFRNDGT